MNARHLISSVSAAALLTLGLAGCGSLSTQDKSTITGAGIGAVGGALLGNSPAATVGGAAVGGVIGHQVGKDKK